MSPLNSISWFLNDEFDWELPPCSSKGNHIHIVLDSLKYSLEVIMGVLNA